MPAMPDEDRADEASPAQPDVRLVAFYLPQYHPIPENDAAWGTGFTEWTNVTRARPLFEGHHQPQLPTETGFYDLRLPEVMEQQAALAREHGIHAFCYYYYWFDGRRLLEKPLEAMLRSGRPDMPFCLCWANESWTRRWDGADKEVIVQQTYLQDSFARLASDLLPYLKDPRYLRIDGRPLVIIYRPGQIRDCAAALAAMRRVAAAEGIELCIAACIAFDYRTPREDGFDLMLEFPPLSIIPKDITADIAWTAPFEGRAYSYDELVSQSLLRSNWPAPTIRTAMVSWDNTARRGSAAHLFPDATPELFEAWLSALVARARRIEQPDSRIVFINAWNEWGEGNHLEPDRRYGRQWLRAVARAVGAGAGMTAAQARETIARFEERLASGGRIGTGALRHMVEVMHALDDRLRAAEAANEFLGRENAHRPREATTPARAPDAGAALGNRTRLRQGQIVGRIEQPAATALPHRRDRPLALSGWLTEHGTRPDDPPLCIVALIADAPEAGEPVYAVADHGLARDDADELFSGMDGDGPNRNGFAVQLDLAALPSGPYRLRVGLATGAGTAYLPEAIRLELA